jgi:hypothetical protein
MAKLKKYFKLVSIATYYTHYSNRWKNILLNLG